MGEGNLLHKTGSALIKLKPTILEGGGGNLLHIVSNV